MNENKYEVTKKDVSLFATRNVILREIKDGSNVILDIGCNNGYFGMFDTNKKNIYYGLDIMEIAIDNAKKYYKDAIIYDLNALYKLPWDIKFDYIIFADVLEHVVYPEKVLQFFIENYLKINGCAIISLPNIANWAVRFPLLFGIFNYKDKGVLDNTHLHFYTYSNVINLFKETNLKIERKLFGASYFGYIINICPMLKGLLATDIIITCKYEKNN